MSPSATGFLAQYIINCLVSLKTHTKIAENRTHVQRVLKARICVKLLRGGGTWEHSFTTCSRRNSTKIKTSEKETTEWRFKKNVIAVELYTDFLINSILPLALPWPFNVKQHCASLSLFLFFLSSTSKTNGSNFFAIGCIKLVFFFLFAIICGQAAGFNSQNRVYIYCHFDYRNFVIISSR